jgi:hypothetical protein
MLIDCESGRVVVVRVSKFLLCLIAGQPVSVSGQPPDEFGMLRRKARALAQSLEEPLSAWVAATLRQSSPGQFIP